MFSLKKSTTTLKTPLFVPVVNIYDFGDNICRLFTLYHELKKPSSIDRSDGDDFFFLISYFCFPKDTKNVNEV